MTQQVGGSLGLAILSTVSTARANLALGGGDPLRVALTHGFQGGFPVAAMLCGAGLVLAIMLLPRRQQAAESRDAQGAALASARCPGAPNCGHLARQVVVGPRNRSVGMAG
jgi:hypothetical protein